MANQVGALCVGHGGYLDNQFYKGYIDEVSILGVNHLPTILHLLGGYSRTISIYRRLRIGCDGHFDQSEAYDL